MTGICYHYAMRSTRRVVHANTVEKLGHYSDPPLLVLASLASGPKPEARALDD